MTQQPVQDDQLGLLPSVPECRLGPEVAARLPASHAPPPWAARLDAVVWVHRTARGGGAALPGPLRGRAGVALTVAGLVRYGDTPVGPYAELFASPTLLRGRLPRLHVPLMAVDSLASLAAGRRHWALPKAPATFQGRPAHRRTVAARGEGWWVRARVAAHGPAVPALLRVSLAQVWPDGSVGTFAATIRCRARLARVAVEVSPGASFAAWLRPGRHHAVLLRDARLRLQAPRAEPARPAGPAAGSV